MHAFGPPEKDAKTTGHGLTFSSYTYNIITKWSLENHNMDKNMAIRNIWSSKHVSFKVGDDLHQLLGDCLLGHSSLRYVHPELYTPMKAKEACVSDHLKFGLIGFS